MVKNIGIARWATPNERCRSSQYYQTGSNLIAVPGWMEGAYLKSITVQLKCKEWNHLLSIMLWCFKKNLILIANLFPIKTSTWGHKYCQSFINDLSLRVHKQKSH